MPAKLLILGGTTEASVLARKVAEAGLPAVFSYAGRVDRPREQPVPVRVGGFGGVAGLARYLCAQAISHVIDATHPFAAQMSTNAVMACAATGVPLIALTRAPWSAGPGDHWTRVSDMDAAVAALAGPPRRVFLAVGRMHLAAFAAQPQHRYLLRLVDRPDALPLPGASVVIDRGPFSVESDIEVLRHHQIEWVVSKNAGGTGARSKIDAARQLGVPVLMIDRPAIPARPEAQTPAQVLGWLAHSGVNLGV